ncbi:DEAD/DEAH box helicase family protein [Risungbinella massiliensis]|uniref:DEAD/DEAH box helicase family protein n=1 Tax=Risungbinella massiliensis TaxID=1329796 RepID=UPI00069B6F37|nr:DEAD/DEAH box helicase family protein [Risungbinella massiliensis]
METLLFQGRRLLHTEIEALLRKNGHLVHEGEWDKNLKRWSQMGMIRTAAVTVDSWIFRWKCNRCGAGFQHIELQTCANCSQKCGVCTHCRQLGIARSCNEVFLFPLLSPRAIKQMEMDVSILYSEYQKQAIQQLTDHVRSASRILVYAVTGAGKTEMMLPIVKKALEAGERVLWVIPRKEVVQELAKRLSDYFPQVSLAAWSSDSSTIWKDADFLISTAHQMVRFHEQFGLVIVDEVDAFPLYGNPILERAVDNALCPGGTRIYLTATPSYEMRRLVQKKKISLVVVPQRYHGRPLPIPKLYVERKLWKLFKQLKPIPVLSSFLQKVRQEQGQAFLFIPTIDRLNLVERWLHIHHPQLVSKRLESVHSRDRNRVEKVEDFRQGKTQILLTTTILERGVTVPGISVLVLGSDHRLYDQQALLQISGRVGRSKTDLRGIVWFVGEERTEAQERAVRETIWLNQQ